MNYKKYDTKENISFTFGAFPTFEILKEKPEQVIEIITHEKLESDSEGKNLLNNLVKNHNIRVSTNGKLIEKLSGKGNIYIMAVFKKYKGTIEKNQNHIVLNNPSDMGNLGTIIRAMLGFGYRNLAIISPGVDHMDPRVIRASMGSIFSMNIEVFDSIEKYLEKSTSNHIYPFMLKAETTLQNLQQKEFPHTLIFGNEATGLEDKFLQIGTPIKINQSNKIDSFNLSMAVSIAVYEFSKSTF